MKRRRLARKLRSQDSAGSIQGGDEDDGNDEAQTLGRSGTGNVLLPPPRLAQQLLTSNRETNLSDPPVSLPKKGITASLRSFDSFQVLMVFTHNPQGLFQTTHTAEAQVCVLVAGVDVS